MSCIGNVGYIMFIHVANSSGDNRGRSIDRLGKCMSLDSNSVFGR